MRVTARVGEFLWRPLTTSDGDTDFIIALRNHPRFRPWFYSTVTRDSHLRFMERARYSDDVLWIIERDRQPVGISSIYDIDWSNRKTDVGRIASLIPRVFQLNFLISATVIFEGLKLNKACIETLENNRIISRGVERMGMTREGLLRDHICRDGKFLSVLVYGIIAADWFGGERDRQIERYGRPEIISIEPNEPGNAVAEIAVNA